MAVAPWANIYFEFAVEPAALATTTTSTAAGKRAIRLLRSVEISPFTDSIDPETVKTGLAQYQAAYTSATDDTEKSEAEIGVDCYQAMAYSLEDTSK